ncbi:MAG: ATP-binding cassette domain-containing protein [Phycisphaeraceae bacterium]|nr:ATP-binding cassette domain-containing protein [Phycisphaeraceae bacterium]MCW5755443.1 ATP-binding cassette domain-containing protein [Phycisphaeraceae bacterium]
MLKCSGVHVAYGKREVLRGVSFELEGGAMLAVIGPNGSGKTTLLRAVVGGVGVTSGEIALNGAPVGSLSPRARARMSAYAAQRGGVAFAFTVREVVEMGGLSILALPGLVDEVLADLSLEEVASARISTLSIGQQQRVSLARVLVQARAQRASGGKSLILVDEPTSAMDPFFAHRAMSVLQGEARAGSAVVVVLHDFGLAERWCTHGLVLDESGVVRAFGPIAESVTPAMLEEVFKMRFAQIRVPHDGGEARVTVPVRPTN